jgi:GrpB-like predicted nucleotidyltransferase (UPF0157 family)
MRNLLSAPYEGMRSAMTGSASLGLPNSMAVLFPYTLAWKRLFEEERAILPAGLGDNVLDIQHVGSTSLPGMLAKPILGYRL